MHWQCIRSARGKSDCYNVLLSLKLCDDRCVWPWQGSGLRVTWSLPPFSNYIFHNKVVGKYRGTSGQRLLPWPKVASLSRLNPLTCYRGIQWNGHCEACLRVWMIHTSLRMSTRKTLRGFGKAVDLRIAGPELLLIEKAGVRNQWMYTCTPQVYIFFSIT